MELAQEMKAYEKYIEDFVGKNSGPKPREKWDEAGPEFLFDPIENIERTRIPILAFFGERDKQADPIQGAEAYRKAVGLGKNTLSKVVMVPGVDHVLVFSPTGCIKEWQTRAREQWNNHSPVYLDTMEEWLITLKKRGA